MLTPLVSRAAVINVVNGDDLQAKIDGATGGDVLLLGTGTYSGIQIDHRHFTEAKPLIIKAAPGAKPIISGSDNRYGGYLAKISDSSYIVFDGLTMEYSNQPVYCTTIDHFIFVNLEIHNTGQEMIGLHGNARYIDIINCKLYDSGHNQPQWAEGIYVGRGSPPNANVENVWIEGNEIFNTGNAEGINVKAQCFHITIRGNKVHDIPPGTATQHNEAAISCEAADLSFKPGVDPDIWIENNEVYNIRFGRWANGIKASTAGGKIINNKIHDCEQYGIEFNAHMNGPGVFTTWLHGNMIANCKAGAIDTTILPTKNEDPGPNPNKPQAWYVSSR
ncbi:MAG: right-handed parallel beta-helix repeat-containing protein [Opitutaceae bacterium]